NGGGRTGRGEMGKRGLFVILVATREICGALLHLARGESGHRLADLARQLAAGYRGPWIHTAADAGIGTAAPRPAGDDHGLGTFERSRELGPHRVRLRQGGRADERGGGQSSGEEW